MRFLKSRSLRRRYDMLRKILIGGLLIAGLGLTGCGSNTPTTATLDEDSRSDPCSKENGKSYCDTCLTCVQYKDKFGGFISCTCPDGGGNVLVSALNSRACLSDIKNCSGKLTCGDCPKPKDPVSDCPKPKAPVSD